MRTLLLIGAAVLVWASGYVARDWLDPPAAREQLGAERSVAREELAGTLSTSRNVDERKRRAARELASLERERDTQAEVVRKAAEELTAAVQRQPEREKAGDLERELADRRRELNEIDDQLGRATAQSQTQAQNRAATEAARQHELSEARDAIDRQIARQRQSVTGLKLELTRRLQANLDLVDTPELDLRLRNEQARLSQLEAQRQSLGYQVALAERQSELGGQLAPQPQQNHAQLRARREQLQARIDDLQTQIDGMRTLTLDEQNKNGELKARHLEEKRKLDDLEARIARLKSQ